MKTNFVKPTVSKTALTVLAIALSGLCSQYAAAQTVVGVKSQLLQDGHILTCQEGADTLANSMGFKLLSPSVTLDAHQLVLKIKVSALYVRCEEVGEGAISVKQVSPYSAHTYSLPQVGTVSVANKTVQLILVSEKNQLVRKLEAPQNSGALVGYEFEVPLESVLTQQAYAQLLRKEATHFAIYLSSQVDQVATSANGVESTGLTGGGTYVLTGRLDLQSTGDAISAVRLVRQ